MKRETKIKLAKDFRAEGLPLREVGALLGVSYQAIRYWTDEAVAAYDRERRTTPAYKEQQDKGDKP